MNLLTRAFLLVLFMVAAQANAHKGLLEELHQAGVTIYLCGQTAAHRGFEPNQLLPQVTLAVSAMTVHVRLQQEGYRAILF